MRNILSNLIAALLLVHALVGCCRHRDHQAADNRCPEVSAPAHSCCGHAGCEREKSQPPTPCKCKIECHSLCVYLPPQKGVVTSSSLALFVNFAGAGTEFVTVDIPTASGLERWQAEHFALQPPIRLHLLHQIILI